MDEAAPRLHKAAHYARRALGGETRSLVLDGETVALYPDAEVDVDAVRVRAVGRVGAGRGGMRSAAGRAADAYAGDLLPQDPYELVDGGAARAAPAAVLKVLRLAQRWETLAAVEPGDEQAHLALIRRLADAGDRRAALRQFERLERGLRRELGVAPSASGAAPARRVARRGQCAAGPPLRTRVALVGRDRSRPASAGCWPRCRQGRGRVCSWAVPRASARPPCSPASRPPRRRTADAGRQGSRRSMIEGDWPYAPVLEALADLCRHHPASAGRARRRPPRRDRAGTLRAGSSAGTVRARTSGSSSRRRSWSGWPPRAPAR